MDSQQSDFSQGLADSSAQVQPAEDLRGLFLPAQHLRILDNEVYTLW